MVQFGEHVYAQFQRGITPSTPDQSIPSAPEGTSKAGTHIEVDPPGYMDSLLELWETGQMAEAPDSAVGIAHVLTRTQQACCLHDLGTCYRQLLGRYEALWRHPDTVRVDERDWLARRVMGEAAGATAEELKPLHGRILRTTADLGPLVTELDKTRTPSFGQWQRGQAGAEAGEEAPQTPELVQARGHGHGAAVPEDSFNMPWELDNSSFRGPSEGHDRPTSLQPSCRGRATSPDGDAVPWLPSDCPNGNEAQQPGIAEPQCVGSDAADEDGCWEERSSCQGMFGLDDCVPTGAAYQPLQLDSSVSTLMKAIAGDARLAGEHSTILTQVAYGINSHTALWLKCSALWKLQVMRANGLACVLYTACMATSMLRWDMSILARNTLLHESS